MRTSLYAFVAREGVDVVTLLASSIVQVYMSTPVCLGMRDWVVWISMAGWLILQQALLNAGEEMKLR